MKRPYVISMRVMCIHYTPESQFLTAKTPFSEPRANATKMCAPSTPIPDRPFDILSDVFAFENLSCSSVGPCWSANFWLYYSRCSRRTPNQSFALETAQAHQA